ncbi:hypothetical protein N7539_005226 [Penicillium diatomitis]|uniref:Survival Motor Neuron Gemin2-binding domain-containing protein n=1 Tax=Penicillium diatomitis TaxID=2819901 RepID=A0A9W9X679_9EURO|nr:uncharacterized protein N7539_005226 [Penicillium diatomitis]KAJ5485238.1 hypothetical protein N7539_005226 [Penicillium diatomitis]
MGKNKSDKALTHEEIWDDSALVQSWDDAVEEYKLYHSIHAKGENVDDVLKAAEVAAAKESQDDTVADAGTLDNPSIQDVGDDDAIKAESEDVSDQTTLPSTTQKQPTGSQIPSVDDTPAAAGQSLGPGPMPMPGAGFPNVQDDGLRNLMMAWYFAGYYTGLYEGQHQSSQSER